MTTSNTVRVRPGDTLSKLVQSYNRENGTRLTVRQVADANGIRNIHRIRVNSSITFPDAFVQNPARSQPMPGPSGDGFSSTSARPPAWLQVANQWPPRTQRAVAEVLMGLPEADVAIVVAKAQELVKDNASVEQTSPEKFAANMVAELTEYLAQPGRASDQMMTAVYNLYTRGKAVIEANPQAHQTILRRIGLELTQ